METRWGDGVHPGERSGTALGPSGAQSSLRAEATGVCEQSPGWDIGRAPLSLWQTLPGWVTSRASWAEGLSFLRRGSYEWRQGPRVCSQTAFQTAPTRGAPGTAVVSIDPIQFHLRLYVYGRPTPPPRRSHSVCIFLLGGYFSIVLSCKAFYTDILSVCNTRYKFPRPPPPAVSSPPFSTAYAVF